MRSYKKKSESIAVELRKTISYCPDTGICKRNGQQIGKLHVHTGGWLYSVIYICGCRVWVHHVAWLLSFGSWPQHEIDHINGNGTDNRLLNLRDVPHAINMKNKKRYRKPSVKHPGISIRITERGEAYRAQVGINGKTYRAKTTYDLQQAIADRVAMLHQHGYSELHTCHEENQ